MRAACSCSCTNTTNRPGTSPEASDSIEPLPVLRVSGKNTTALGIHRATERDALLAAASIGVAPEVAAYLLPEGHLVTRWLDGVEWSPEEFRQPGIVRRVAAVMGRIHALPAIAGIFDPYRDIEDRLGAAKKRGAALPDSLERLRQRTRTIEASRTAALAGRLCLCHNDPWHNNFLDDGTVRLLDWEFAGMGDPFFDLASIAGASSPEENAFLLDCYFGEATSKHIRILDEMLFVVVLWNATWALIQTGMADLEHDYPQMARDMFGFLEARL